jgi:cysteinyl-tRNA synthetase
MFRLYDTQQGEVVEVRPARPGLLRIYLGIAGFAGPARVVDLRAYVLADLIRRNAERHGSSVIVCQDTSAAGALASSDSSALSIAPPDLDCAALSGPGASHVVDVGVGAVADGGAHGGDPTAWQAGVSDAARPASVHHAASAHQEVRHWVRSGPVLFDGQATPASGAMAASTDPVQLADVSARGLDPLAVRLAFLAQQYREQLALTWDLLAAADADLRRWRELVATWANEPSKPICAGYWSRFAEALDDDLDTAGALTALRDLAADGEIPAGSKFETFAAADRVLGLELVSLIGKLPA